MKHCLYPATRIGVFYMAIGVVTELAANHIKLVNFRTPKLDCIYFFCKYCINTNLIRANFIPRNWR